MRLPRLSRRTRRWIRHGLAGGAWLATILLTVLGLQVVAVWYDQPPGTVRHGSSGSSRAGSAVVAARPAAVPQPAQPAPLPATPPELADAPSVPPVFGKASPAAAPAVAEPSQPVASAETVALAKVEPAAAPSPPEPAVPPAAEAEPLPAVPPGPAASVPAAAPQPVVQPPSGQSIVAELPPAAVPEPPPPVVAAETARVLAKVEPAAPPLPAVEQPAPIEEAATPVTAGTPAVGPAQLPPSGPPGVRPRLLEERLDGATIAIVIDDMGYSERATRRLIAARRPLTLAFLPKAPNVAGQAQATLAAGIDVLIHMPMEPVGKENPGRGAIRVGMPAGEIQALLEEGLAAVPGAIGLNNHMGSRATADLATMQPLMATLARHGLFFFDSRTSGRSLGQAAALAAGVPAIGRDVFLDNEVSHQAVSRQLKVLERLAQGRGYAVAIGHPHAATIDALLAWMPQAEARGIRFTALKTLVPIDTCRQPAARITFDCAGPGDGPALAGIERP